MNDLNAKRIYVFRGLISLAGQTIFIAGILVCIIHAGAYTRLTRDQYAVAKDILVVWSYVVWCFGIYARKYALSHVAMFLLLIIWKIQ